MSIGLLSLSWLADEIAPEVMICMHFVLIQRAIMLASENMHRLAQRGTIRRVVVVTAAAASPPQYLRSAMINLMARGRYARRCC